MSESGFLHRWARRKAQAQRTAASASSLTPAEAATPAAGGPDAARREPDDARADRASGGRAAPPVAPLGAAQAEPNDASVSGASGPVASLPDLATLTPADDFSAFMAASVDAATRNGALRKLFADPRFNVMDGLDTYVDDYSQPAPLRPSMLRTLRQAHAAGLFDEDCPAEQALPGACPDRAADTGEAPGRMVTSGEPTVTGDEPPTPTASRPGDGPTGSETTTGPDDTGFASASGAHYDGPTRRAGSP